MRFLSYHKDRFIDRSQLVFKKESNILVAVLPLAESNTGVLASHPGATYGGLFPVLPISQTETVEIFESLFLKLKKLEYKKIIYKPTPHVFHKQIWENDIYALHKIGIEKVIAQPNSVLDLTKSKLGRQKNRKKAISKGCKTTRVEDAAPFYNLLKNWLNSRHQTNPVHSLEELFDLQLRFPQEFIFLETRVDNELVAGCLLIILNGIVHTQYFALSELGMEVQALDNLIEFIASDLLSHSKIISFGSSSDKTGKNLNEGLISFKEGFGSTTHILQEFHINIEK
jgi:hypothetical protein